MSRNRSNTTRSGNRHRRTGNGFVRFMRGLVIETLGVAALGFLYVTMQASAAGQLAGQPDLTVDETVISHPAAANKEHGSAHRLSTQNAAQGSILLKPVWPSE